ncbi:hypothetical protein J6590_070493 [Homalodisca vitripennis]|nr:hypothetical protein J6590_070493 [Homalodisca vitripennis]
MNRVGDPAGKKRGPEDKRCKFSQKNRMEWPIKSFKPFKALGADGIFPDVGGNIGSVFQLALVRKQISWDKCGFPTIDGGNIGLVSQLALVRKQVSLDNQRSLVTILDRFPNWLRWLGKAFLSHEN